MSRTKFLYCVLILNSIRISYAVRNLSGWSYINIHCRDNDNKPVDWWYLYKPPPEELTTYFGAGRNFSYISSDSTMFEWEESDGLISANSMLSNTISPIFRPTYRDYLAMATFDTRHGHDVLKASTDAHGIMLADQLGGFWIGHNIPGFPDISQDRVKFPEMEYLSGHLIYCISVDLVALNNIAARLKQAQLNFTKVQMPRDVKPFLPNWNFEEGNDISEVDSYKQALVTPDRNMFLSFTTLKQTANVTLMAKSPGDMRNLYQQFGQRRGIALDVYSGYFPTHFHTFRSRRSEGTNRIHHISLKFQNKVIDIDRSRDRMRFGVSEPLRSATGGHWTCVSNLDEDDLVCGGFLVCMDHFGLWTNFNRLKA